MTTTFGAGGANSFCGHTAYGFPSVAPISEDIRRCQKAAVVGYPHDIKGQGIYAYVTLLSGEPPSAELHQKLVIWGTQGDWADSNADLIQFAPGLPKTCSGKIMRRILRKIARMNLDRSVTADPTIVDDLICQPKNR